MTAQAGDAIRKDSITPVRCVTVRRAFAFADTEIVSVAGAENEEQARSVR